jgi:hypothetical protein
MNFMEHMYKGAIFLAKLTPQGPKGISMEKWSKLPLGPLLKNTLVFIFSTTFYCF